MKGSQPARFGRFEIEETLGRGGAGVVYLARDPHLGRKVALKLLEGQDLRPDQRARFLREAQAAAQISHPHVVKVFEAGEEGGVPYLAMERIEGEPLDRYAQRAEPRAFLIALEKVARGVQSAHERGICHRDLKPENVLVDGLGCPFVTDFGVALFVDEALGGPERLTKTGQLLGTPLYMAPEQLVGDLQRIGPRTDVWALGTLLYEGVTGRTPFSGANFSELLARVLSDEPLPPSRVAPGLSRDMDTIALRALAKDPAARFADAGEFADELARHLRGEPLLSPGPRSRPRWTLIPIALLGALGALGAWAALPDPPSPPTQPQPSEPSSPARVLPSRGATSVEEVKTWAKVLAPNYVVIDSGQGTIRDRRRPRSSSHVLLRERPEDPLVELLHGEVPALRFRAELAPGRDRVRSEVRIRGGDLTFADLESDPVYYTQLTLAIPSESDAFERERTRRGDWSCVWQCSQLGASPPHYYRVTSPPLSLQLYGRRLFVRSFSDYARYSEDLPDEELELRWQRRRGPAGQEPELGETTRGGGEPAKVRREPLNYAGYLAKGGWTEVFMEFKLGRAGFYRVWVGGELQASYSGPIGYRSADYFGYVNPKLQLPGQAPRIRKRASVRFGIYQGFGDPAERANPRTSSELRVRRFALGTDEGLVRGSSSPR